MFSRPKALKLNLVTTRMFNLDEIDILNLFL